MFDLNNPTDRRRVLGLVLPDADVLPEQLRDLAAQFEHRRAAYIEQHAQEHDLRMARQRREAEAKDTDAAAAALRAGKPDPGRKHVAAAEKELADAEHVTATHGRLLNEDYATLAAAVQDGRDAALADAAGAQVLAVDAVLADLDRLRASTLRLAKTRGALRWVREFPELTTGKPTIPPEAPFTALANWVAPPPQPFRARYPLKEPPILAPPLTPSAAPTASATTGGTR